MTKINARSPYFLSYGEPVVPNPEFTCDVAKGVNFNFNITQRGVVEYSGLAFGTVASISSTDSGFANGKYADVSSPTNRTVVLKIAIPPGFSNSADSFLNCTETFSQPVFVSGTTCTANTSLNGSISDQTLATNGTTTSALTLSSKFTAGSSAITGYKVVNEYPNLISTTAVTETGGANQTIQFTTQNSCGVAYIQIFAVDALSNSCDVFQQAKITVNGCNENFTCTIANLTGGAVSSAGVITLPNTISTIPATGSVSVNSDGSNPISGNQPFSTGSANTTGSARNVTLYFKILIPAGYANTGDGAQYIWCPKTFVQQSQGSGTTTLPTFDCVTANHTDYTISARGAIGRGKVQFGTIKTVSSTGFDQVNTDTDRSVAFVITSPNEPTVYSNPNTDITCTVTIKQPAYTADCGTNNIFLSQGFVDGTGGCFIDEVCFGTFTASTACTSNTTFENLTLGNRICLGGNQSFRGGNLWYGVRTFSGGTVGLNAGSIKFIKIDSYGLVQSTATLNCDAGCGSGGIQ